MFKKNQQEQQAKKKGGLLKKIGIGLLFLVVLGVIFGGRDETATPVAEEQQQQQETATPVAEEKEDVTELVEEETTEPEVSKEFQNALKKAESYAKTMHMSKKGIYDQLTSEYGEGFPEDAAQYAVDTLVWDYNENAYEKAKSYQDTMSMSLNNIKDQLTSEYGEQFTAEEAEYAINKLSSEE